MLARDDDGPVSDWDPNLNEWLDDVNTYIEFIIPKARKATFPDFFANDIFNRVTNLDDLGLLEDYAPWANIKMVSEITYIDENQEQWEIYGTEGAGASMILTTKHMSGFLVMHEFGHLAGCDHREKGSSNFDLQAIMANGVDTDGSLTGNRVNRIERDAMQRFNPGPIWNN